MASSRTTTRTTALVAVLTALLRVAAGRSMHRVHGVDPDVAEVVDDYQNVVPYYETAFQPCPKLPPANQLDVDQLLGTWHLSLLLLADRAQPGAGAGAPGLETLLDDSLCAGVELTRANASLLRMDWQLHQLGLPAGLADMRLQLAAAELGQPGLWALATPLGGELLGTVTSAAARSHLVLTVCGARDQDRVEHVLTALLTRRAPSVLGSLELLRLSSLMMPANGYRRLDERLLSWGQC